jgi:hypothetical protein
MVGQRFLQRVHPNPVLNLRHVASHLLPRDSHVSLERIEGLQQVRLRELEYGASYIESAITRPPSSKPLELSVDAVTASGPSPHPFQDVSRQLKREPYDEQVNAR